MRIDRARIEQRCGELLQARLDLVVSLLFLTLFALAPSCLNAQTARSYKTSAIATAKSQASRTQGQGARILFDYHPSPLVPTSNEHVFVTIAKDGTTQAVRYGSYSPAIIAVYEGRIPPAEVARLMSRMESVIPRASEINKPYAGSCDADQFQLSLSFLNRSATPLSMPSPGCLLMMPEEIRAAVAELRIIWQRLNERRLEHAYLRSFPFAKDHLNSSRKPQHFVSIKKMSPKLRAVVRNASVRTPRFYGISQAQYNQLRALTSDPSTLNVIDKGRAYYLPLLLSRGVHNHRLNKGVVRFMKPQPPGLTTRLSLTFSLTLWLVVFLSAQVVRAGDGTFSTTDGINGTFSFCVVLDFNATPAQIDYIQRAFRRGSDVLADATQGHHRFGTVNIVNNCGNGCAAAASAEYFIVGDPQQDGAAAAGGQYGVHGGWGSFSIKVFDRIALDQPGQDLFLNLAGYTVAHEFAHQAYDVADEYGGQDLSKPNGQQWIGLGANCAPGVGPGAPPMDDPNLDYCLMDYFQGRGGMSVVDSGSKRFTLNEFCVASNHDPDRNNHQSFKHKNKSCWETIALLEKPWRLDAPAALPDPNPPPPPPPSQPVTFGTTCGAPRVVFVLDRSGSMETAGRLGFAKLAANLFITFATDGYSLGVVSFSNSATVNYPLTQITDEAARNAARTSINSLAASGATNIGGGLEAALNLLTGPGDCSTCQKSIILLTDGDHNVGTPPELVTSALQKAGVTVTAAVLGSNITLPGEASIKNITRQTGGRYLRVGTSTANPGLESSSELLGLFLRLASDLKGNGLVAQQRQLITSGGSQEYPIMVEQNVGTATFTITKNNQTDAMSLSLRTPSGNVIGESNAPNIEFISDSNSRTLRITAPQSGLWKVVVSAGSVSNGKYQVLSFAKHQAVRLNSWVDTDTVVFPNQVRVHASPLYGGVRVVGATVTGNVIRPDGQTVPVTLFDDGDLVQHGDAAPNDGIYSANFNNYGGDGTHTFELTATNSNGRTYEGEFSDPSSTVSVPPFWRADTTTAIVSGLTRGDMVWFDDALPTGAIPFNGGEGWHWVDANPGSFSGGAAHQSRNFAQLDAPNTSLHQHFFTGATAQLPVNVGDKLFAYIFLDINSLPREVMLQWHDGNSWEHRAYWGQDRIDWGIDGTNSRRYMGPLPKAGQWVRLEIPASLLGLEGSTLNGMAFTLDGGRATWDLAGKSTQNAPPPPTTPPGDFVWLEDSIPAGAIPAAQDDHWEWVSNSPAPFSGNYSHRSFLANGTDTGRFRYHSFTAATTPMQVNPGDVLFTYAYLDPTFTPDEIVLQWHEGDSWEHRAFWGVDFVKVGVLGSESRRYAGAIPPAGQWVRLEVPASHVGLEGKKVTGMAFGYYKQNDRARVSWDKSGKAPQATEIPLRLQTRVNLWRVHGTGGFGYYRFTNSDVLGWDETVTGYLGFVDPKQAAGTVPMHAFRNSTDFNAKYFYTTDRDGVAPAAWPVYLGPAFYVFPRDYSSTPGTVPLYLFEDGTGYFFTTNYNEGSGKLFHYIAGYVYANNFAPPQVAITSPGRNAIFTGPASIVIEANASDPDGGIVNVEFFQGANKIGEDTDPPYSFTWANAPVGSHRLTVRATDNNGLTTSDFVDITVNSPPTVSLTSPANGAVFVTPANIALSASAADSDGLISKVEFYQGSSLIGTATASPFALTWNNVAPGSYSLTAIATDNRGATATSSTVSVTVRSIPSGRMNVALAANGGVASASSTYPTASIAAINNGDRRANTYGATWADDTSHVYPDWVQIDFAGSATIDEVALFSLQDNFANSVEPTESMTGTNYVVTSFVIEYWTGSAWQTVTNGTVSGNNLIWRKVTFPAVTTTKIKVTINATGDNRSQVPELEVYGQLDARRNVALAANGGVASASSTYPTASLAAINNGDRRPNTYGATWADDTSHVYPDWVQIDFAGSATIDEVALFSLQDNFANSVEPTESMTGTNYVVTSFVIEYWTGSAWQTITNGTVSGNNLIWRKVTFPAVTTTKIKVTINATGDNRSQVPELEVYGQLDARRNVALAANGGVASASSTYPTASLAAINNGDRRANTYGATWADDTSHVYPDWVQIDFAGSATIDEVALFSLQDNFANSVEPTESMTGTNYVVTSFVIEYWTGSAWQTITNGTVSGNNLIWRRVTFPAVTTTKIKVTINATGDNRSQVPELEVYGR